MPRLRLRRNLTRLRSDLILLLPSPALSLPDLARNRRTEGRGSALSPGCRWQHVSLSLSWLCIVLWWESQAGSRSLGRLSSLRLHHRPRIDPPVRRRPLHPPFRSPRRTPLSAASDALGATAPPQDAAPTANTALPDQAELLQTIARDLANVERNIEQLKADQQQMARENSKAIGELKASQEEMKRTLVKVPGRRRYRPRRSRLRACASPSGRISRRM